MEKINLKNKNRQKKSALFAADKIRLAISKAKKFKPVIIIGAKKKTSPKLKSRPSVPQHIILPKQQIIPIYTFKPIEFCQNCVIEKERQRMILETIERKISEDTAGSIISLCN